MAPRNRYVNVQSVAAGRLDVCAQAERLERRIEEVRRLHDVRERDLVRIEVEQHVVGPGGEVFPRRPDVQIDATEVDHPQERGFVLDERIADDCPTA